MLTCSGGVGRGRGVGEGRCGGVGDGVTVAVAVAVAVGVNVAVAVAVGVCVAVAVAVAVGVNVAVAVAVAVGVCVAVAVAVGVAVGVNVADGLAVGVGLAQPPPATLTSTEVVVLTPVYPPTAIAVLPTAVPTGKERCWLSVGPLVQVLVAGSYTCRAFVVSGLNSRLNHALTPVTPLFPDVRAVLGPVKGLPPPKTHSLPAITAEPGTLTPLGILARVVHVLAAMS